MRAYEMTVSPTCHPQHPWCLACRAHAGGALGLGRNVASLAELSSRKVSPRGVMSAADVRHVIAVGDSIGSGVGLMLRLAAVTGARRAELAALQWTDVVDASSRSARPSRSIVVPA